MEGFTEKDAQNLQLAKDAIGEKAAQGDVAAAAAFASLLRAETDRGKTVAVAPDRAPASVPSTWTEAVSSSGKLAEADTGLAAVA